MKTLLKVLGTILVFWVGWYSEPVLIVGTLVLLTYVGISFLKRRDLVNAAIAKGMSIHEYRSWARQDPEMQVHVEDARLRRKKMGQAFVASMEKVAQTLLTVTCVLVLFGGICLVFWTINWCRDNAGYVSHVRTVDVDVTPAWLVGELKPCTSFIGHANREVDAVYCGLSYESKRMQVTFYGRMEQPEYQVVQWDCRRYSQSFICWQTGGVR